MNNDLPITFSLPSNRDRELEFQNYCDMVAALVCSVFGITKSDLKKRTNQAQGILDTEWSEKCRAMKRKLRVMRK